MRDDCGCKRFVSEKQVQTGRDVVGQLGLAVGIIIRLRCNINKS